jgi:hypothetical protein
MSVDVTPENLAELVEETMASCLFEEDELVDGGPPADAVCVDGIIREFHFHPARLEQARKRLQAMIGLLPDSFFQGKGGGWTVLNLCVTKDGTLWTGFQTILEELVCLCMGLGMAKWCLPRSAWEAMPGGMPYVVFDPEGRVP